MTKVLGRLIRTDAMIPATPGRILLLKQCCLGDVLLTTPLLAAVRAHFPAAHITYGVGQWSRPMVATSQDVDAILTLPDRWTVGSLLAVVRSLRHKQIDLVIVPDRSPLMSLLVWLAGIPVRVGLDSQGRGFGYTHRVAVPAGVIHEADLYNLVAKPLGIDAVPRRLFFWPTEEQQTAARAILDHLPTNQGPLVIIHPGGGANPGMTLVRKRWLPERWAIIADRLIERCNARVVIVGGPTDEEAADALQQAMRHGIPKLIQRWDWGTLAAVIAQADCFLGHDTGMMHLACAVGTPTLAVFGPSDPQMYGPYGEGNAFVWHPTMCSPCFVDGAAPSNCPCAGRCMEQVEVEDVWRRIEKLLENR